ncbi:MULTISPECIES: hypothetical protein [Thermotoga]|jgi:hypothetical protein|uniref:Uncharacterized protein n=1 Tax=Thermotoga neapolitana (strain ATCC 49049 / DSM 4359 / NBRC 107923 / NS-E) TaxID=309803 RepID=B9K8N8_THENN|nr:MULTISPECIES: hypothetical protein [Thermotoga]MDK2785831.1 hypothetical protein [Thermotoga sp.]HBF11387.1 hypothetical protein [Thermotoga neapolitana]ACM23321.1 Putative uncharacterized protein precursor [Thermotoga neapolitana DSM 4359]AJG41236.1 hypothetical protein TRQ7_07205 [Thermotoga sp. RQ7]KFZ21589.1 hypothetical protein LA10_06024 [Thermotoga neapolitana LA10]
MKKIFLLFLIVSGMLLASQLEIFSSSGEWAFFENPARVFTISKQGLMGSYSVLSDGESLGTFLIGLFQPPEANIAGALFLKRSALESSEYVTSVEYDVALSPEENVVVGAGASLAMDQDGRKKLDLHGGVFGYLLKDVGYSVSVRDFTLWSQEGTYMGGVYTLKLFYDSSRKNRFSYCLQFDQEVLENRIDFVIGKEQKAGLGISMVTNTDTGQNAFKISLGFYANVNNVSIGFDTFVLSSSVSSNPFSEHHYTRGTGIRFAVRW